MSITRQDILQGAFTSDPLEVLELVLSQRGLRDVGLLASEAPNLTKLNLAFNQLTSLSGLASITGLTWLNVSHNGLAQLGKALSNLDRLTFLNLSNNKLSNIDCIAACTSLQELYLQHNKLMSLPCFKPIAQLSKLSKLCIAGNPVEKKLEHAELRASVVAICPSVSLLDGLAITDAEGQMAADTARSFIDSAVISDTSKQGALDTHQPEDTSTSSITTTRPASTSSLMTSTSNGSSRKSYQQRGSSYHSNPTSQKPKANVQCIGDALAHAVNTGNVSAFSDTSSVAGSLTSNSTLQGVKKSSAASKGIIKPLKQLPATSKFQEVLAALPQLDQARLPPTYSPGGPAATRKAAPVAAPADASNTVYEIKYTAGARNCAVRCKQDGSLCINWPGGDLAITVDGDHSCQPVAFRMLAMYRSTGSVAVSWDAAGGFVQYPNGSICLTHSSISGSGTLFDTQGSTLLKWLIKEEVREPVDVLLDTHLGIRFCRCKQQLSVFFACEGIRQFAVCGTNKPEQTWQQGSGSPDDVGNDLTVDTQPAFLRQLDVQCTGIGNKNQRAVVKPASYNDASDVAERDSIAGVMAMLTALNTKLTSC